MESTNTPKTLNTDAEPKVHESKIKVSVVALVTGDASGILSFLAPASTGSAVADSEENSSAQANHVGSEKCSSSSHVLPSKAASTRRRKAHFICVVCGGPAIGYNFHQIVCESCKAFFRRNALRPLERLKCPRNNGGTDEVRCNVQHEVKHKCQRCRLLKCFEKGMRKDFILTAAEKELKKRRLEENRRRTGSGLINIGQSTPRGNSTIERATAIDTNAASTVLRSHSSELLSSAERHYLQYIRKAYLSASQSVPSASSAVSSELPPDGMSTLMNMIDLQNFTAMKLIRFLQEIPEFQQLDICDRITLVKYNLTFLFFMRHSSTFDSAREVSYDIDMTETISPNEEAFAHYCKSLFILCYGYSFSQTVTSILRSLTRLVNRDPVNVQLFMLIMIFSKGLSATDDQEQLLSDPKRVFYAQSKYADLLFRYLMEQSSFREASLKMARFTEQLLKIQKASRHFQQCIKTKVDLANIHPLMKSLLHG